MVDAESKPSPSMQRFQSHAIHATLEQWQNKVRDERPNNFRTLGDEPRDAYVRLRWVLRDLKGKLEALNPLVAQVGILNQINKHISQLQGPWDQFKGAPAQHWQALDGHTDGLISHIRNLSVAGDTVAAWREFVEEISSDMNAVISAAKDEIQKLQNNADGADKKYEEANEKLKGLETEISNQKARLDKMLTQHSEAFSKAEQERGTQFTAAEQNRGKQFTAAEQDRAAKFTESTAAFIKQEQERVSQFSAAQEERKTKHASLVSAFTEEKNALIKKHQTEMEAIESKSKTDAEKLLKSLQEQLDKAVEIVGTVVKTSMSGNYQIVANREYHNAWIMRGAAILSFVIMGGMVIWAVSSMDLKANGIDWSTFAFRLSLGTAFLIPGIFCARESSRHWNSEKHNRRIALELAALDPFLVKLDEVKQKEIIEKKADEYFGRGSAQSEPDELHTLKNIHLRGDQLFKLVEQVAKIVRGK